MPVTGFLKTLESIFANDISQIELNRFIEECAKIASFIVKKRRLKIQKYIKNGAIEINDISITAISPLFIPDENNELSCLKNSFCSWKPQITTESEAEYFIHNIIHKRVEQQISLILRDMDPLFSKIHHTISYYVKSCGYSQKNYYETKYIIKDHLEEDSPNFIPFEELSLFPAELFTLSDYLLPNLFKYIKQETNYSPAIPLNCLVKKIKEIVENDFITPSFTNFSSEFYIDEIIEIGLKKAYTKLDTSYYRKNKLNDIETEVMKNALKDVAEDLRAGSINHGLFDYFEKYMKKLSRSDYKEKYNSIFEYIIKFFKLSVADQLI